jgi:hypothetical protein
MVTLPSLCPMATFPFPPTLTATDLAHLLGAYSVRELAPPAFDFFSSFQISAAAVDFLFLRSQT